jgi:hypothetical protein
MRRALVAAVLWLAGCAGGQPAPTRAPTPIEVQIEHRGAQGWLARIEAGSARELRFARPSAGREAWRARNGSGALPLVREGAADVIRAAGPLGRIEIELPEDERPPEKDYRGFLAFSRGGVLVYTGQLAAELDGELRPQRVTLVPLPAERVIARGQSVSGPLRLDPLAEDGTYACFCTVEPVITEDLVAVVDEGMWSETAKLARELLPRLFALYREALGRRLPWRPTVFLSGRVAGSGGSVDMGGGTLDALVQIHVGLGPAISPAEAKIARAIEANVAHEAAHLWVGQLLRTEVQRGDWMYEGAADALSWRALQRLGVWDADALAAFAARAASVCVAGGAQGPLAQARVKAWYGCGAMVTLAAEASARARRPGADAFALWRAVFARSRDGIFGPDELFAAFADAGADPSLLERLRARVEGAASAPAWEDLLREAGLRPASAQGTPEQMSRVRRDACGAPDACPQARWVVLDGL